MSKIPATRLHHNAYVTKDHEKTRQFYEDLIGLPLVATWCESDELFGKMRTYCHTFYGMGDGGALAFFQFADDDDQAEFDPDLAKSPFRHIALKTDAETQAAMKKRLQDAGYTEPEFYILDHGYCESLYVEDPNGLLLEFTVDHESAPEIDKEQRGKAHQELKRWLDGDHTSNNPFR